MTEADEVKYFGVVIDRNLNEILFLLYVEQ